MFNIGPAEAMVVLVIALLVLGPNKLPDAARQVGRALAELRRMSSGFQAEMRDALKEPVEGKPTSTAPPRPAATDGALSSPRPPAAEAPGRVEAEDAPANNAAASSSDEGGDAVVQVPDHRVGSDRAASEPGANGTSAV